MTPRAAVLYVTYDGLMEPLGASQVLPYVRGLVARGHDVELISFEKPADLEDEARVSAVASELKRRGVPWTPLRYHKRPSLPATAWDVLAGRRHVAAWARARRRAGQPGLVHARGYLPGLMGLAGRAQGAKLLFDMRGFWVDERIEGGYWAPESAPARLGRWAERKLLAESDHLIVLTRKAGARLPDLSGGAPTPPWAVIPTCVDLEKFRPAPDAAAARNALGLEGPVLIHVGTVTGWYDGQATMAVARAFVEETGGSFVVLTRDADAARRLVEDAGIRAVVATAPSAEVPRWLHAADAGLSLVRPSPSNDARYPTKVAEYLAAGLTVLATPAGDLEELADGSVLTILNEGDDPGEAARRLAAAAAAPDRIARARSMAERHLGVDEGVASLDGVYRALGVAPEEAP